MSGRLAAWVAVALLGLACVGQGWRLVSRLGASQELQRAERLTVQAARMRGAGRPMLRENLQRLEAIRAADPLEVGIPIAIGGQHLLLGDAAAAEAAYREALQLEPRPEIFLNLGRAQAMAGERDKALVSFETAMRLDPNLKRMLPLSELRK